MRIGFDVHGSGEPAWVDDVHVVPDVGDLVVRDGHSYVIRSELFLVACEQPDLAMITVRVAAET